MRNDQSDKSYSHLLYEHLLGLENHITAVVSARAGPILSWLKSLPLTSICSWLPDSKDVVFLINGQMFSCKGSLEHVVQVNADSALFFLVRVGGRGRGA